MPDKLAKLNARLHKWKNMVENKTETMNKKKHSYHIVRVCVSYAVSFVAVLCVCMCMRCTRVWIAHVKLFFSLISFTRARKKSRKC